jgi:hypothetical protein
VFNWFAARDDVKKRMAELEDRISSLRDNLRQVTKGTVESTKAAQALPPCRSRSRPSRQRAAIAYRWVGRRIRSPAWAPLAPVVAAVEVAPCQGLAKRNHRKHAPDVRRRVAVKWAQRERCGGSGRGMAWACRPEPFTI